MKKELEPFQQRWEKDTKDTWTVIINGVLFVVTFLEALDYFALSYCSMENAKDFASLTCSEYTSGDSLSEIKESIAYGYKRHWVESYERELTKV
jgi:hypothetical protein